MGILLCLYYLLLLLSSIDVVSVLILPISRRAYNWVNFGSR